jgi:hypothetical protein
LIQLQIAEQGATLIGVALEDGPHHATASKVIMASKAANSLCRTRPKFCGSARDAPVLSRLAGRIAGLLPGRHASGMRAHKI